MKQLTIILIVATLSRCSHLSVPKVQGPEAPFKSWPNQTWAAEALATVRNEGLAKLTLKDAGLFCANGMSERNWVHLMAAVVKFESNFKPTTEYKESFKSSSGGDYVISTGLFQISKSSTQASRYGCKWASQAELRDPIKNIQCAGKVIRSLVAENGAITNHSGTTYKGMGRYWSVMRPARKLPDVKAKLKPWCE